MRGVTFKKDFDTATNGSDDSENEEDDPMLGKVEIMLLIIF